VSAVAEYVCDRTQSAALNSLRFNKTPAPHHNHGEHDHSYPSSNQPWGNPSRYYPPQQSRDASGGVPSPYLNSPPHRPGNVLVPSSSPLGSDVRHRPYQDYSAHARVPPPSIALNGVAPSMWTPGAGFGRHDDPLMQPSGFTSHQPDVYASSSRYWNGNGRGISEVNGGQDDGPPRKRPNYGAQKPPSQDPMDLFSIQESPIRRAADVLRAPSGSASILSKTSSGSGEDSSGNTIGADAGSTRRIVRGQRPPSPRPSEVSASETDDETRFNRFRLTFVDQDADRVRAAWNETNGDAKGATALIMDSGWSPKVVKPATKTSPSVTGRVKEVDDATKAQRAAIKEKGKQSAIYNRNRAATSGAKPISLSTPSPVKPTMRREPSPPSPLVVRPRLMKKAKKAVVDSESESDSGFSDTEDVRASPPASGSNEGRVFDYLNTAATDALQELTGWSFAAGYCSVS
jgi:SWI/SNF-related matrix-associated actin-dependent regulator of chromatin subfamily A containing DEAD/H box 1